MGYKKVEELGGYMMAWELVNCKMAEELEGCRRAEARAGCKRIEGLEHCRMVEELEMGHCTMAGELVLDLDRWNKVVDELVVEGYMKVEEQEVGRKVVELDAGWKVEDL